jgi:hypothetical protein
MRFSHHTALVAVVGSLGLTPVALAQGARRGPVTIAIPAILDSATPASVRGLLSIIADDSMEGRAVSSDEATTLPLRRPVFLRTHSRASTCTPTITELATISPRSTSCTWLRSSTPEHARCGSLLKGRHRRGIRAGDPARRCNGLPGADAAGRPRNVRNSVLRSRTQCESQLNFPTTAQPD